MRVLGVQFAVGRDQALAAIGHQKRLKEDAGVDPVGGQLVAVGVDVAHALCPQLVLHRHEKVEKGIPGIRNVLNPVPGLLDQRPPDIERNRGALHRHRIIRALLCDAIISIRPAKCGVDVLRLNGFDDVADIDELVGPGVQREKREIG